MRSVTEIKENRILWSTVKWANTKLYEEFSFARSVSRTTLFLTAVHELRYNLVNAFLFYAYSCWKRKIKKIFYPISFFIILKRRIEPFMTNYSLHHVCVVCIILQSNETIRNKSILILNYDLSFIHLHLTTWNIHFKNRIKCGAFVYTTKDSLKWRFCHYN